MFHLGETEYRVPSALTLDLEDRKEIERERLSSYILLTVILSTYFDELEIPIGLPPDGKMEREREILLVFVRHGETEANREGIIQGSGCDFPLTEKGVSGAVMTGQALRDAEIKWDFVCSSPLLRAYRTATIIASHNNGNEDSNGEIEQVVCVRERGAGILEGLHFSTSMEKAKKMAAEKQGVPIDKIDNSAWESEHDVIERHLEFLNHLVKKESLKHGSRVLCVCHGAFITLFLRHMCGNTEDLGHSVANCSLSGVRVLISKESVRCLGTTHLNYTDHLWAAKPGEDGLVEFEREGGRERPLFEWLKSYTPLDR